MLERIAEWWRKHKRDKARGYTDADITRVHGWLVKRENICGNEVYLKSHEMAVWRDYASEWDVSGLEIKFIS